MRKELSISIVFLSSVGLLFAAACSKPTHEERVAAARSRYEASINGFVVLQQPLASPEELPATAAGDEATLETTDDADGGEDEAWEDTVDLRQDVLLDVVIRHDSFEKLPGITVDITMADGEREIETWRILFDTTGIEKGPGVQYSHTLENIDYREGYGFAAEVRFPVPVEERSAYREFSSPGE